MTQSEPDIVDAERRHDLPWESTDWTVRQRATALRSMTLIALTFLLIAGALSLWGTGSLAMAAALPLGLALVCVFAARLATVFWYPYRYAHNRSGSQADSASLKYGALALQCWLVYISLALQLMGILVAALRHQPMDELFTFHLTTFFIPMGVCLLISLALGLSASNLSWRPTRDPALPEFALDAPVRGWRLACRWAVMVVARNSWLLIGGVWYLLVILVHTPATPLSGPIVGLGAVAVLFLLATVSELTNPQRRTPEPR